MKHGQFRSLIGKVVIINGASSRIGLHCARICTPRRALCSQPDVLKHWSTSLANAAHLELKL